MRPALALFIWASSLTASVAGIAALTNDHLQIRWSQESEGWRVKSFAVRQGNAWNTDLSPLGDYTLLYSEEKPSEESAETFEKVTGGIFPEENYIYQKKQWRECTTGVALNTAGVAYQCYPKRLEVLGRNHLRFHGDTLVASIASEWHLEEKSQGDIFVRITIVPRKKGYFSCATPSVAHSDESKVSWAMVPGYFQGNNFQTNNALAYAYGHGIPKRPFVFRERCASTLCPLVSTKSGITLSVIPEPGLARDPWAKDEASHGAWCLGLSHQNRQGLLSPTLYYPVLGEINSYLEIGQAFSYSFRISAINGDWFKALNHAIYDLFWFREGLALRESKQSLSRRVERMHTYLSDPKTSRWNVREHQGRMIGAQSYLGGVIGSKNDAMKNSDYGAMWMLGTVTKDPKLVETVLPLGLNFKLAQQQTNDGFFQGAAAGQYYLANTKTFSEEWGEIVEPIALTYYVMVDIGNMLLFCPENQELRDRLRLGAERLLSWQKPEGCWAVAYDRHSGQELFLDIKDLRPTFYGLIVAHRILKDARYLTAARKGADWFIENAVRSGSYIGVCGDARYAPDFATAQSAQALLDLYEITKDDRYLKAAIAAGKSYVASIYTHPIPNRVRKTVKGVDREDWEIAQSGLSFEHGGVFGSANSFGPILLCSHAGLFVRLYQLAGESLFIDMARAAAIGRDAFIDADTSVASYYWKAMNKGPGQYPHHAWWQVGWITDYLLSEAELRSNGRVSFPRGFVTPKVGPHQSYGFAPGIVFGDLAELRICDEAVRTDNPAIDYVLAVSKAHNRAYVIFLNNSSSKSAFRVTFRPEKIVPGSRIASVRDLGCGERQQGDDYAMPEFGIQVVALDLVTE